MTDSNQRLVAYERILERHRKLLSTMEDMYTNEPSAGKFFKSPNDVITEGPTVEQRREAAKKILPYIFADPEPLQIYLPEPIMHRRFGNPLRWYARNMPVVHPDQIPLVKLVDHIGLVYDIIYNSWDVRIDDPEEVQVEDRERIGGDNDLLAVWESGIVQEKIAPWEFGSLLRWGFHRRGVQSVVTGFGTIKYRDFIGELSDAAEYVAGKPLTFEGQHNIPLSYDTMIKMLDAISTIGEGRMAGIELEDEGLKRLTSGGFRIADDLVTGSPFVRS